jgi:hypothetical protein
MYVLPARSYHAISRIVFHSLPYHDGDEKKGCLDLEAVD